MNTCKDVKFVCIAQLFWEFLITKRAKNVETHCSHTHDRRDDVLEETTARVVLEGGRFFFFFFFFVLLLREILVR